jgi:hypothetical protein
MQGPLAIASRAMQPVGSPGSAEMDNEHAEAEGWLHGCVRLTVQRDLAAEGKVKLLWQGRKRQSTLRYQHMTYHHFKDEKPNSIRLKGLHDECIVQGYDLDQIEKWLDEEKIAVLRESPTSDGQGGQPVILKITVRDRL